jgi:hypothetical protein
MLERKLVEGKMNERGFTVYATINGSKLQFISKHMYDFGYEDRTPPSQRQPVINIFVNLDDGEFECFYNMSKSMNQLKSPKCSPVMNDEHFDRIVMKFESEAKWLSRLERCL